MGTYAGAVGLNVCTNLPETGSVTSGELELSGKNVGVKIKFKGFSGNLNLVSFGCLTSALLS